MLDLDHFKMVNDTHGHAGGDSVLRETARRMQQVLRAGDVAARWGGERSSSSSSPKPSSRAPLCSASECSKR